jgi:hypothetical protein
VEIVFHQGVEKVWYSGRLTYSATEKQVQIAWTIAVINYAELIIMHLVLQYVNVVQIYVIYNNTDNKQC